MTPDVELHLAAQVIRDAAEAATANPCPDWIGHAVRHVVRNCDIPCVHTDVDTGDTPDGHATWDRYGDATHLTLWTPGVAVAIAAWLDDTAGEVEDAARFLPGALIEQGRARATLAVARAINGRQVRADA